MPAGSQLGLRILLAALLLLNVSGLCAAMSGTTQPLAHSCCPKAPQTSQSLADCCITSAVPVKAQSDSIPNTLGWPHSAITTCVDVHLRYSHPEVTGADFVCPPEPLFIRFHQFLI